MRRRDVGRASRVRTGLSTRTVYHSVGKSQAQTGSLEAVLPGH